jgi:hypothetical protein
MKMKNELDERYSMGWSDYNGLFDPNRILGKDVRMTMGPPTVDADFSVDFGEGEKVTDDDEQ